MRPNPCSLLLPRGAHPNVRVPKLCRSYSSRPVARFRPSTTCMALSLRTATRDLDSGSGLTANRTNQFNASGLYPAFNAFPFFLDQRFAVEPCSPSSIVLSKLWCTICWSPNNVALDSNNPRKVTLLDPRTPHQPENLRNCQRTIMVLRLLFFRSMEKTKLYVL